jgi:excisionase family DNA binding protein
VAKMLKITFPTLHDWTKLGYLKAYKLGSRVLYKELEVKETLEKVTSFKHKKGGLSHV